MMSLLGKVVDIFKVLDMFHVSFSFFIFDVWPTGTILVRALHGFNILFVLPRGASGSTSAAELIARTWKSWCR